VWSRYLAFLKEHGVTDDPASYAFLTCGEFDRQMSRLLINTELCTHDLPGDWDLKTMLPRQLAREAVMAQQAAEESDATPDAASDMTITPPLDRWINIKNAFRDHYKKVKGKRATGMEGMLAVLGMQLEGKHHSGIDDCRNILRIVQRMRNDGWKPEDEPVSLIT
jgi:ERI1 exoribonuclease 3